MELVIIRMIKFVSKDQGIFGKILAISFYYSPKTECNNTVRFHKKRSNNPKKKC